MASNSDLITDTRNAARPNSARVTSGRTAGATTLACDNLSGWPTASKVHFVTYTLDSLSKPVTGSQLDCYGIVSGNNINSFTVVDGTDAGNLVNDVVEMLPTAAWGQGLSDWGMAQHSRTGTHVGVTNTGGLTTDTLTVSGASTLTGGTTLPAGDIGTADIAAGAITPEKLLSGSGSSWSYQSYTPTLANITLGNGTMTAGYTQIGKLIDGYLTIVFGTTSVMGSVPTFTLPVTSIAVPNTAMIIGIGNIFNNCNGFASWTTTTTATLRYWDTNNNLGNVTATAPGTWGNTSFITIRFSYPAA